MANQFKSTNGVMEPGSTYSNIEEYLEALEKRQMLEKAPTAAIFCFGSADMWELQFAGLPWLTRVRCELPTRPLGPGGEEEPIRATYVGACSGEDPARYERFVKAMASIDIYKCVHLRARPVHPQAKNKNAVGPSDRALAHLEQSDLICVGDGGINNEAWYALVEGPDGIMERIKWRYYSGAVLIGVGTGCQLISKRWWIGDPRHEVRGNAAMRAGMSYDQLKHDPAFQVPKAEEFVSFKSTEIVPAFVNTGKVEDSVALCELYGAMCAAITIPPRGALIFNVDGTFEPACALLHEHVWKWKSKEVKMSLLAPPDEKTNILKCSEYLEKKKARIRAKRLAMGLSENAPYAADTPINSSDDEEETDEYDSEEEEERREKERRAAKDKRAAAISPFYELNKRKKEEADFERQRGAELFKRGDWEMALRCFNDAIKKLREVNAPGEFKLHLNRAATLLKLEQPRRAVLAADRALHLCEGKEAKAWYRRASAWLAAGEFNEAIADADAAKRIEPSSKEIVDLRKKAETDREDATWGFAYDSKIVEKQKEREEEERRIAEESGYTDMSDGGYSTSGSRVGRRRKKKQMIDEDSKGENVVGARTMIMIESFMGDTLELHDGNLTLSWMPTREAPDGKEETLKPACLDQRALFCIEELTKRSRFNTLSIKGSCLGAWGAAFIARGARIEGAGLETIHLVDCRLRAEGAKSIASLLSRGSKLVEIDLSGNGIGDDGMHAINTELTKNEYLEVLKLARNRIANKRMAAFANCLGMHPVLRSVDLSHNKIGFPGVIQLAGGVKESQVIQHLNISHNAFKVDAIYRIANTAQGHPSLASIDVRGVMLRKADRRKLEEHTKFTRLQIFIDPAVQRAVKPKHQPVIQPADAKAIAEANGKAAEQAQAADDDDEEVQIEDISSGIEEISTDGVPANGAPPLAEGEEAVAIKRKGGKAKSVSFEPAADDDEEEVLIEENDGPSIEENDEVLIEEVSTSGKKQQEVEIEEVDPEVVEVDTELEVMDEETRKWYEERERRHPQPSQEECEKYTFVQAEGVDPNEWNPKVLEKAHDGWRSGPSEDDALEEGLLNRPDVLNKTAKQRELEETFAHKNYMDKAMIEEEGDLMHNVRPSGDTEPQPQHLSTASTNGGAFVAAKEDEVPVEDVDNDTWIHHFSQLGLY